MPGRPPARARPSPAEARSRVSQPGARHATSPDEPRRASDTHPVVATLHAIEVADTAIRKRWPKGNEPPGLFSALQPPPALRGKAPALFESFANELAERVLKGQSLEPATDAEVLATATRAPLNHEGQLVAEALFERVFPESPVRRFERESYPGELAESLRGLRNRLRVPGRWGRAGGRVETRRVTIDGCNMPWARALHAVELCAVARVGGRARLHPWIRTPRWGAAGHGRSPTSRIADVVTSTLVHGWAEGSVLSVPSSRVRAHAASATSPRP